MSEARRKRRAARRKPTASAARPAHEPAFSPATLWVAVGLVVGVAVAYWPVGHFGFVRFDDPTYVTQNPHVLNGITPSSLRWAFTSGYGANWHPMTWLSHMLDVQLYGFNAGPHHLTNVVLHAVSSVLLFAVLFRMTGAPWRSAAVGALFALHPLHVESVAWIAERKDVLSAFFWILTLWAYVAYVRTPRPSRFVLVIVAFVLGLMAKPMVVTLPFALLLLDVWPLRRLELGERWRSTARPLVREKLPLLALSLASSVITFVVQRQGGTVASSARLPLGERLGNALIAYVAYLGKTFWPLHLAAYYPYPATLPAATLLVSVLLLLAISTGALLLARSRPYLIVGWLWYLGTLVPAIGIVQVGTQAMADRYTYIPLIGISIMLAWGLSDLLSERPRLRIPTAAVAAAALVACAIATRLQVRYWASSEALWKHALAVTTDNYAAHTYYGNALASRGNLDSAIIEYDEAIRIRPGYPEAHNNLGPALAQKGRVNEAIEQFTQAIRLRPNYADAYNNLGVALASQGKFEAAINQYSEALRLDPDDASARANLGLALQGAGRTADAVRELELALQMNPNNADARNALIALQGQRR
ncbi:MAG TPA: tetratricopeptide repeat protein [Gemmatimonadaceae bacterium]|nr:tetratricopeptide repeat protein [Gemmatimonadaceae bacterium]